MTKDEYDIKLEALRKTPQYKKWVQDQNDLIMRLRSDTEAIDPGDSAGDDESLPVT